MPKHPHRSSDFVEHFDPDFAACTCGPDHSHPRCWIPPAGDVE